MLNRLAILFAALLWSAVSHGSLLVMRDSLNDPIACHADTRLFCFPDVPQRVIGLLANFDFGLHIDDLLESLQACITAVDFGSSCNINWVKAKSLRMGNFQLVLLKWVVLCRPSSGR